MLIILIRFGSYLVGRLTKSKVHYAHPSSIMLIILIRIGSHLVGRLTKSEVHVHL